MKLSPVLSKFLAAHKQLSLPGLGTFYSDGAYNPDFEGKKATVLNNVSFKQEKVNAFADELIEFISKETGKMKVLAASDISSQLEDALQFINTGKPYFFAGIGTLTKKPGGGFDFFPEKYTPSSEKKKEKEIPITEKNHVPQSYIDNTRTGKRNFKPALIFTLLALVAVAATAWFYFNSQKNASKGIEDITAETENTTVPADSATARRDSANIMAAPATPADTYTYVLEVAKEPRASRRFNQLKEIKWPVELETIDSLNKRIVMKLPRVGADTARIKDSLRVLSGRQVFIVQ